MRHKDYLVFDIETAGQPLDVFEDSQQEYLLRGITEDEQREQKIREFALSPFTAEIVAIGMSIISRNDEGWKVQKEGVLALDNTLPEGEQRSSRLNNDASLIVTDEKTLLGNFWKVLHHYPTIHLVSFNGRGFDAPFLMLRSALHQVRPARNLMEGTKWNYPWHTDLADELAYYGFQSSGPMRRFNFDFYARSFGITSPKAQGIDGSKVTEFYEQGRLDEIAEYCMRDVRATWELFLVWEKYLKFDRR